MLGGFASQLRQFSIGLEIAKSLGTTLGIELSDYNKGYFRPYVLDLIDLPKAEIISSYWKLKRAHKVTNGDELLKWYEKPTGDVFICGEATAFKSFFEKYPQFWVSKNSEIFKNVKLKQESKLIDEFKVLIADRPSIGVHVRLGDFTDIGWGTGFDDYKARIGYLLKQTANANVIFFSNEIEKVKEAFGPRENFYFMNHKNGYVGDIEEFICLSMCMDKVVSAKSGYSTLAIYTGSQSYGTNDVTDLNEEQMGEGLEYFSTEIDGQTIKDESIYNMLGAAKPVEKRVDTLIWNSDCFSKEETSQFWREYYGKTALAKTCYVYSSYETYNRWFDKGLYVKALNQSRLGTPVLYINNKCYENFYMPTEKITEALNMDGVKLGFDLYLTSERANINKQIVDSWLESKGMSDYRVVYYKDRLIDWIKKIINRLFSV